jgi:two-component system, chemotaxis family, CheB/CheR fusion protein
LIEPPLRPEVTPDLYVQKQADRILLSYYTPAGVIVDRHLRVHEFRGSTGRYIEHAPGSASLNLLQMVRPSLIVDLRTAIHKALKDRAPMRKEGAVVNSNGLSQEVNIQVVPFTVPPSSEIWLLVLFEGSKGAAEQGRDNAPAGAGKTRRSRTDRRDPEVVRLRAELDATKESLQVIIEEQEATNEELKSANEEIESSNEELQSTNEELETAKEELQSTNEELTTLNEELSNRNTELAQVNNDLTNLLSSISIPILMVDNALAVRRATPMAERLFNLIPTDIGRRLSDLKANLNINNLDQMIRQVLDTLSARETKVQDHEHRWYSLRIRPYRTRENKIDGAVITLVDIDEEQRSIARLELASHYNDTILDTMREPLVVLDADLRVRQASRSFYQTFKLTRKKTENTRLFDLGDGEWNLPPLRQLLESLPQKKRLENFRLKHALPKHGRRTWLLNARMVESSGERLMLLALEDVTTAPASRAPMATARS